MSAVAMIALGAFATFQPFPAHADDTATEIRLLKERLKQLEQCVAEQGRNENQTQEKKEPVSPGFRSPLLEVSPMSDSSRELLVILNPRQAAGTYAQLQRAVRVTQIFEPRLALIRDEPGARERAEHVPGVLYVGDGDLQKLTPDLTPSERLFVAAWVERMRPKSRKGEGLQWDAPGFQPPDGPLKH